MQEKPINLTAPEVRAFLDGRKTQLRLPIKPQPPEDVGQILGPENYTSISVNKDGEEVPGPEIWGIFNEWGDWGTKCPLMPGDRLWVRETTWISECKRYIAQGLERGPSSELDIVDRETGKRYIHQHSRDDYAIADGLITSYSWRGRHLRNYRQTDDFDMRFADVDTMIKIIPLSGNIIKKSYDARFRKKLPSVRMPRIAARIWLEVVDVRVEQVQNITDGDTKAEGIRSYWAAPHQNVPPFIGTANDDDGLCHTRREAYQQRWDSINAKKGYRWDTNPLVWVLDLKMISPSLEKG